MARKHARIVQHVFAPFLQGALLDSYQEEQRGEDVYLTLNIRALEHTAPPELLMREQTILERIHGNYIPARLQIAGVSELKGSEFHSNIVGLPRDDLTRTMEDLLSWQPPGRADSFFLFAMQAPQADSLMFFARRLAYERLPQDLTPITLERNWSPPPPMSGRLVPRPTSLHRQFGGDPITVHIGGLPYHRRLFIGSLETQPEERPQVDVVFNVGEKPSKWVEDNQTYSKDRWDNKGEGTEGMSLAVIRAEAGWVIKRLQNHERVLVHCVAGLNRSSTICCAVLILLEGVTAEQALERVREHHPWARPDSRHWLKLRWLAKTNSE